MTRFFPIRRPDRTMNGAPARGFTLAQLMAVTACTAVAACVLLPALATSTQRNANVICLSHLKGLSAGFLTYSQSHESRLPGPLYPGVTQNLRGIYPDGMPTAGFWRGRMLTWKLREVMTEAAADRLAICPTMNEIVPDSWFTAFRRDSPGRAVYPMHYGLNNYGSAGVYDGSLTGSVLGTKPPYYFGSSYPDASDSGRRYDKPPVRLGSIPNPSAEWAVADAWFRPRATTVSPRLQQEGPYQTAWSGEALPNFAPHMRRNPTGYRYTDSAARIVESNRICQAKLDGWTNAAYFDGHAASVPSRRVRLNAIQLFYGFPGTQNWDDQGQPLPPIFVWE